MTEIWAITNHRVSTDEQLKNGSLNRQKDVCLEASIKLNATIVKTWSGSVSSLAGKNVSRKDLLDMLAFCKSHKKVKFAIFDEYDRYMRSINEGPYFEVLFQQLGVKVWYASESDVFNGDDALAKFMRSMSAFKAEGSNEERQRKSIAGHTGALKEGRYGFRPKAGYRRGIVAGIHAQDDATAPILKSFLIKIADRSLTPSEALKEINNTAFTANRKPMKMDKFRKIITDSYYAGIVEMHRQVDWRNETGMHEPLISIEQHERIVAIDSGHVNNQAGPRKNGNPKYPLNNLVTCVKCIDQKYCRVVGFDHTNGSSNGIVYQKYRCRSCKTYIHRQELHDKVIKLANSYKISDQNKTAFKQALKIVWNSQLANQKIETTNLKNKKTIIEKQINQQAIAAIDIANLPIKDEILKNVAHLKQELQQIEYSLVTMQNRWSEDEIKFVKFALDFTSELGGRLMELDKEKLTACKEILFPNGFLLDENKNVYTTEISPIISVASIEKDPERSLRSTMVRVKRL